MNKNQAKTPAKNAGKRPLKVVHRAAKVQLYRTANNTYYRQHEELQDVSGTAAFVKEGDQDLEYTGIAEYMITTAANPQVDPEQWNFIMALLPSFFNVAWITVEKNAIRFYVFVGYSDDHVDFKRVFWRYRDLAQSVLKVNIENSIDPAWQDYEPCNEENSIVGINEFYSPDSLFPERSRRKRKKTDDYNVAYATEYQSVLPAVLLMHKYGIDMVDTDEELMDRCSECVSIGGYYGRALYHTISQHHCAYNEAEWDEMFDGMLAHYNGERSITTLKWCIDYIYAPRIKKQIELQRELLTIKLNSND